MTLHQSDIQNAHLTTLPHFSEAQRVVRPLIAAASIHAAAIAVLSAAAFRLGPAAWQPGLALLRQTGALGAVCSAVILALGAALSCLVMVHVRRRAVAPSNRPRRSAGIERSRWRTNWRPAWLPRAAGSGRLRAQALLLLAASAAAMAALPLLGAGAGGAVPATATWFVLAGVSILAAFPLLVAERVINAIPPADFPEQSWLRPFALLPLACLSLLAAADAAQGLGLALVRPTVLLLGIGLAIVAIEQVLRAGLVFVLPLPDRAEARTPINSLVLRLFQPALGGPASWSAIMRERFGIDFARSWALRFVRRAAAPIAVGLAVLCVFLTGVVRIDSNERGIYQRLGRPVAVLRPGLHLILPWPLGQVRRTEYGVVHAVPIRYGSEKPPTDAFIAALEAATKSTVDGPAPASANRLWDANQPSDVSYIISSDSRGQQSFETISVSMRVLWRVGLDDASARAAAYSLIDPDTVVRSLASQLLARYLASRTLAQLLGEDHSSITSALQASLQQALDRLGAGIQVVSVIVEAMHPPGGAAAAYRLVQAAEIEAHTEIAAEQGRAEITAGLARRDAAATVAAATATAAERLSTARIVRANQQADAAAWHSNRAAFALDLYLGQVSAALSRASLEIVDNRIGLPDGPTLDLRPLDQAAETTPLPGDRTTKMGDSPQ